MTLTGQMTIADFNVSAVPLTQFKDISVGDIISVTTDKYKGKARVTRVCSDGMLYAKIDSYSPELPFPYECINPDKESDDWTYEERD